MASKGRQALIIYAYHNGLARPPVVTSQPLSKDEKKDQKHTSPATILP